MVRRDSRLRERLTAALPVADLEQVSATAARARPAQLIRQLWLQATGAGGSVSRPLPDASLTPLVVVPDAEMPLPHLTAALEQMGCCVYVLAMPPQKQMAQLRSVPALAALWVAAVRTRVPAGVPVLLAGIGAGGVVAHEMAVQLQLAGEQVRVQPHSTATVTQHVSATGMIVYIPPCSGVCHCPVITLSMSTPMRVEPVYHCN